MEGIDYLEALDNPERFISRRARHGEDEYRQRNLEELLGAGFMGRQVVSVKEPRGPFGQVLQGIGLLDEPQGRPLSNYEQMIMEVGAHQKSQLTSETDRANLDKVSKRYNLASKWIKETGTMPPPDFLRDMTDMSAGFSNELREREKTRKRQEEEEDITNQYKRALTNNLDYGTRGGRTKEEAAAYAQIIEDIKVASYPIVKQYLDKAKEAETAAEGLTGIDKANKLEMVQYYRKKAAEQLKLMRKDPRQILAITGENINPFDELAPKTAPGEAKRPRIFDTEEKIDSFLQTGGYTNPTPAMPGRMPTPTPGR